ncbi:MAG: hypothetical protein RL341_2325 [Pseudomonadota bacterium]
MVHAFRHLRLALIGGRTLIKALLVCSLSAALPAAATSFRCTDKSGDTYVTHVRLDKNYSYFLSCEEVPAPPPKPVVAQTTAPALRYPPQVQPQDPMLAGFDAAFWRRMRGDQRQVLYAEPIFRAAKKYGLDPYYLHALIRAESGFNKDAVSPKGAMGLMQIMPATGKRYGVVSPQQELRDPNINIEVGARYLSDLRRMFRDDWYLITAAYNAGEGAVMKYGNRIPPYPETQNYVRQVERFFAFYRVTQPRI